MTNVLPNPIDEAQDLKFFSQFNSKMDDEFLFRVNNLNSFIQKGYKPNEYSENITLTFDFTEIFLRNRHCARAAGHYCVLNESFIMETIKNNPMDKPQVQQIVTKLNGMKVDFKDNPEILEELKEIVENITELFRSKENDKIILLIGEKFKTLYKSMLKELTIKVTITFEIFAFNIDSNGTLSYDETIRRVKDKLPKRANGSFLEYHRIMSNSKQKKVPQLGLLGKNFDEKQVKTFIEANEEGGEEIHYTGMLIPKDIIKVVESDEQYEEIIDKNTPETEVRKMQTAKQKSVHAHHILQMTDNELQDLTAEHDSPIKGEHIIVSNDIREVCVFKFNYDLPVSLKDKSLDEELKKRVLEAIMKQMSNSVEASNEASNELGKFLSGTYTDPMKFPMTKIIRKKLVGNIDLEKSTNKTDWTLSENVYKNIFDPSKLEEFLLGQHAKWSTQQRERDELQKLKLVEKELAERERQKQERQKQIRAEQRREQEFDRPAKRLNTGEALWQNPPQERDELQKLKLAEQELERERQKQERQKQIRAEQIREQEFDRPAKRLNTGEALGQNPPQEWHV